MSYNIKDIEFLPSISEVKKRSQALALLDAIIMPDWEYRYFSFNNNWDGNNKESMASMRDGSGGEYFFHFTKGGVAGKILDVSEIPNKEAALKALPDCFDSFKNEEAFNNTHASFFCWRTESDNQWFSYPDDLSQYPFMNFIVGGSSVYQSWAETYYETTFENSILESIFASLSIDANQLEKMNPEITMDDLSEDIQEIIG